MTMEELIDELQVSTVLDLKNFKEYILNCGIEFEVRYLKMDVAGLTTPDKIYLNEGHMGVLPVTMSIFIIFHEIAHYKSIHKMGIEEYHKRVTNKDFDGYADHVLHEEVLADKWATRAMFDVVGFIWPVEQTQQLDKRMRIGGKLRPNHFRIDQYKMRLKPYYEMIKKYGVEALEMIKEEVLC